MDGYKVCPKCHQEKPISEFSFKTIYKGKRYRHSQCKDCKSLYYRDWYALNGRKRAGNYTQIIILWQKNHPKEVDVWDKTAQAIKNGELEKPLVCSICGKIGRINAHHDDYSKPFDILWVCSSCHKKIHLGLLQTKEPLDKVRKNI